MRIIPHQSNVWILIRWGTRGEAAFFHLPDAIDSLAARLLLAEMAEQTIDVQYYLISSDVVSGVFLDGLTNYPRVNPRSAYIHSDCLEAIHCARHGLVAD